MRAVPLALALVALAMPPAAAADTPLLVVEFEGVHVANGLCKQSACHTTIESFTLPAGARGAYLQLVNIHREPIELQSNFDLHIDAPSGDFASLFHNGLSPAGVYGCWPGELACDFQSDDLRTWALAAEPGEWRVTYRGVHYGDITVAVYVV